MVDAWKRSTPSRSPIRSFCPKRQILARSRSKFVNVSQYFIVIYVKHRQRSKQPAKHSTTQHNATYNRYKGWLQIHTARTWSFRRYHFYSSVTLAARSCAAAISSAHICLLRPSTPFSFFLATSLSLRPCLSLFISRTHFRTKLP